MSLSRLLRRAVMGAVFVAVPAAAQSTAAGTLFCAATDITCLTGTNQNGMSNAPSAVAPATGGTTVPSATGVNTAGNATITMQPTAPFAAGGITASLYSPTFGSMRMSASTNAGSLSSGTSMGGIAVPSPAIGATAPANTTSLTQPGQLP